MSEQPNATEVVQHVLTVRDIASNVYSSVAWDELHGCQEAAPSDCPFQDVIASIFKRDRFIPSVLLNVDDKDLAFFLNAVAEANRDIIRIDAKAADVEHALNLCRIAFRIHQAAQHISRTDEAKWSSLCHRLLIDGVARTSVQGHEWSLPKSQICLSAEAATHWLFSTAIAVRTVTPTAAMQPDTNEVQKVLRTLTDPASYPSEELAKRTIPLVLDSISPRVGATMAEFFSTVFTIAGPTAGTFDNQNVYHLYRYSRFATTSLQRQLHTFGIDMPAFGVILSGASAYVHIDWGLPTDDHLEVDSAMFTEDERECDKKEWDLRDATDVVRLVFVLDRLRQYTESRFLSAVLGGIAQAQERILQGEFCSWKWDGVLPVEDDSEDEEGCGESEGGDVETEDNENAAETVHVEDPAGITAAIEDLGRLLVTKVASDEERGQRKELPSPPGTPAEVS